MWVHPTSSVPTVSQIGKAFGTNYWQIILPKAFCEKCPSIIVKEESTFIE